jgi:HEAT repeat protein
MNWFGRPLSAGTIIEYLSSSNDHDVAHALIQISKQAQDAAEERLANQAKIDARYRDALARLREEKKGAEHDSARKELEEQYSQSCKNIDAEYRRAYDDLEKTFEAAINFSRNSQSRAPNLIEAACGALGAMSHSERFREPARRELNRLLQHSSKVVRRAAACNLANFNDRAGRDIVLEMLEDADPAARANGAIALSRIGLQSDAQRLKKLAESDPDPKVREFAFQGYSALSGRVD